MFSRFAIISSVNNEKLANSLFIILLSTSCLTSIMQALWGNGKNHVEYSGSYGKDGYGCETRVSRSRTQARKLLF